MTAAEFDAAVREYVARTGASETSGCRTQARSLAVGGLHNDSHVDGRARDVVYDAPVALSLAQWIAGGRRLRVLRESTHDHLQPLDWTPPAPA